MIPTPPELRDRGLCGASLFRGALEVARCQLPFRHQGAHKYDELEEARPLVDRLADELTWWLNWAHDAESVPRRSFSAARAAGVALLEELDPRRVGKDRRA